MFPESIFYELAMVPILILSYALVMFAFGMTDRESLIELGVYSALVGDGIFTLYQGVIGMLYPYAIDPILAPKWSLWTNIFRFNFSPQPLTIAMTFTLFLITYVSCFFGVTVAAFIFYRGDEPLEIVPDKDDED